MAVHYNLFILFVFEYAFKQTNIERKIVTNRDVITSRCELDIKQKFTQESITKIT